MSAATSIQFYHLLHTPLERALPKLMEKILASGARAVVLTASQSAAQKLADALWSYDPNGFLPNGMANEPHPESQPIYLTWKQENPNNAEVLIITDGSQIVENSGFSKLLDMFDGSDEEALNAARARYRAYKTEGKTLRYFKQQPTGGWKEEG